jgi:3-oxoacyl-[acyl-carrier-protein] synthase-3
MAYYSRITGWGLHKAERLVTNDDLAKVVDTSDEWISTRTGIKQRYFAGENESTSTMSVASARKALEKAGLQPSDVDLIIVATSSPDHLTPPVSSQVQHMLGCTNIGAMQLGVGCTGFVYALVTAHQFIASGAFKTVLVIGTELISRWLNMADRNTCVLFGDGSAAVVLQRSEEPGGLLAFELGSDGSGFEHIIVPCGGVKYPPTHERLDRHENAIFMNGKEVFKFATQVPWQSMVRTLKKAGLTADDIDMLIPHQANARIIDAAVEFGGLDRGKVYVNVDRYGNTSAASVPLALCEVLESGRVNKGDSVALVAFGAGLTWATAVYTI